MDESQSQHNPSSCRHHPMGMASIHPDGRCHQEMAPRPPAAVGANRNGTAPGQAGRKQPTARSAPEDPTSRHIATTRKPRLRYGWRVERHRRHRNRPDQRRHGLDRPRPGEEKGTRVPARTRVRSGLQPRSSTPSTWKQRKTPSRSLGLFPRDTGMLPQARRKLNPAALPQLWPWEAQLIVPWLDCAPCHSLPDGGGSNRPPSGQPNVPANSRQSGLRVPLAASSPRYLALTTSAKSHKVSPRQLKTDTRPLYPKSCPDHRPPFPLSPVPLLHSHPFGGFGLRC